MVNCIPLFHWPTPYGEITNRSLCLLAHLHLKKYTFSYREYAILTSVYRSSVLKDLPLWLQEQDRHSWLAKWKNRGGEWLWIQGTSFQSAHTEHILIHSNALCSFVAWGTGVSFIEKCPQINTFDPRRIGSACKWTGIANCFMHVSGVLCLQCRADHSNTDRPPQWPAQSQTQKYPYWK